MEKEKILFSWSSGKDSALSIYEIKESGKYEIISLLTTVSDEYDRIFMHGVQRILLEKQAESLGFPLIKIFVSSSPSNDEYEAKMHKTLLAYKDKGVKTVAFGDIFLEDLKEYRENKLALVDMKGLYPVWKRDSKDLVRKFINLGFKAIVTCVDSKVLDRSFVGRVIDEDFLKDLPENVDPCGENGEFHSFVFDGPIFKEKVRFTVGEKVTRDTFYYCDLLPDY
jgi:uncharacterized protein (TIGR00290 family)